MMMFLLQGFLQTVLGYMRDNNCLLGCFKKCSYKQFFAARNSTLQNQLHTCLMKNWDEKFILLDDKVRESDSYEREISFKTFTTIQVSRMLFLLL